MTFRRKFAVFAAVNLVIAAGAAMAPVSLVGGRAYDAQALILDAIDSLDQSQPISVILGDSRSECCLAAAELGFLNLSLEGTTPVEGYYILEHMLDRGLQVERVILSYGPFHVFSQDTFHARTKQFGLFEQAFINAVDEEARAVGDTQYIDYSWPALQKVADTFPWLSERSHFALIKLLSLDETLISVFRSISLGLTGRDQHIDAKLREIVAADRVNNQSRSPEAEEPDARSPVNELYLERLAALMRQHGIARTYVVTPFNEDVEQPPREYFERFDRTIAAAGFDGCYSGRREWPNALFSDSSHLNREGALRFHEEIRKTLRFCEPTE